MFRIYIYKKKEIFTGDKKEEEALNDIINILKSIRNESKKRYK